jgi:hypothetical protein
VSGLIKNRGKGKIPKSEWEKIAVRRTSGEAFASIARDYGCTAPAIRYIVGRTPPRSRVGSPTGESSRARRVVGRAAVGTRVEQRSDLLREGAVSGLPFLGPELSGRISGDVAEFLVAVDAVTSDSSPEMLSRLRSAADSIMRCAARLLLEIERRGGSSV